MTMGDVNGDGAVNVTDVTLLVNHILGNANDNFIFANADVNKDKEINITDVTALVNLILRGNSDISVIISGADGLTFDGGGLEPARTMNNPTNLQ